MQRSCRTSAHCFGKAPPCQASRDALGRALDVGIRKVSTQNARCSHFPDKNAPQAAPSSRYQGPPQRVKQDLRASAAMIPGDAYRCVRALQIPRINAAARLDLGSNDRGGPDGKHCRHDGSGPKGPGGHPERGIETSTDKLPGGEESGPSSARPKSRTGPPTAATGGQTDCTDRPERSGHRLPGSCAPRRGEPHRITAQPTTSGLGTSSDSPSCPNRAPSPQFSRFKGWRLSFGREQSQRSKQHPYFGSPQPEKIHLFSRARIRPQASSQRSAKLLPRVQPKPRHNNLFPPRRARRRKFGARRSFGGQPRQGPAPTTQNRSRGLDFGLLFGLALRSRGRFLQLFPDQTQPGRADGVSL